jgi:hypothetical protein
LVSKFPSHSLELRQACHLGFGRFPPNPYYVSFLHRTVISQLEYKQTFWAYKKCLQMTPYIPGAASGSLVLFGIKTPVWL